MYKLNNWFEVFYSLSLAEKDLMKQKFFIIALLLTVLSGCKKNNIASKHFDETDISQLNDTISALLKKHMEGKDSMALNMALLYTDELLTIDTVKANITRNYSLKTQILDMMGRNREAFYLRDKILPNDPDNIDRLLYNAICDKLSGNVQSSDKYFDRAMYICDSLLSENDNNPDIIIRKTSVFTYRGEKDKAKYFLNHMAKKYPYNSIIVALDNDYEKQADEVDTWLKKIE